ncbi:MAG: hypothetical protein Q9190_003238 [Brigantiaea leucoxantha]
MAELLVEYALSVSSLYFDVQWEISYTEEKGDVCILDGLNGTPDILDRIDQLTRINALDELEEAKVAVRLQKINEAGLTLRNLVLLEENTVYISEMAQMRDFLSIALMLPPDPRLTELKHYALDIAEQVTKYWSMSADDPLYRCLLRELSRGTDRGAVLTTLRAICRISMNLEQPNTLSAVPSSVIENLYNWLLLTDEELLGADLDFLYQFTATPSNVAVLLRYSQHNPSTLSIHPFLAHVVRLCQYNHEQSVIKSLKQSAIPAERPSTIPSVPPDLMSQLLKLDEPDRSNKWMKCVFEEDAESEITQIALWQAYQARFTAHSAEGAMLGASDFIKNVSQIFNGASAQVSNDNHTAKFIIKGIRARRHPVDLSGRQYMRCQWRNPGGKECGAYLLESQDMFEHLLLIHVGMRRLAPPPPDENVMEEQEQEKSKAKLKGKWDMSLAAEPLDQGSDCHWASCGRFSRQTTNPLEPTRFNLAMHVKTHLPESSSLKRGAKGQEKPSEQKDGESKEAVWEEYPMWNTATDEKGDAAGLPLTAALVLRNLARNVPKAVEILRSERSELSDFPAFDISKHPNRPSKSSNTNGLRSSGARREEDDLTVSTTMSALFLPHREKLIWSLAHNRPLGPYVHDVLRLIDRGMEWEG